MNRDCFGKTGKKLKKSICGIKYSKEIIQLI